jgi:hypothetical protein
MQKTMTGLVCILMWAALGSLAMAQDKPKGEKLSAAALAKLYTPPVMAAGFSPMYGILYSNAFANGGIVFNHYLGPTGSGAQQQGKWRLVDDTFCETFPAYDIFDRCMNIYKLADGTYEAWTVRDGLLAARYRLWRLD